VDRDAPVPAASDHLFAALYLELRRLAEHHLRRGGGDTSLTPTILLHEAYLGLADRPDLAFPDRARFLGYAARAMRGLVIDYVRRARAQKRGGGAFEITLDADVAPSHESARRSEELSRLSDAVDELGQLKPALAELVDLHFFCGYTFAEIGDMRGVSERTVQRDWQKARLLLHHALLEEALEPPHPA
jgi:RNA polymerase sigma factor (TIGR02999 family)